MSTVKPTGKELMQLVGNPEVYAVQDEAGAWKPVRKRLTPAVIRQHMEGNITVGTYIVCPPDLARTLVFDIDAGSEDEQQTMLSGILDILGQLGLGEYRGVEFSGKKGYHVWVVAEDYMLADTLYRLGRGIREEAGYPALEVFPKQTEVRDLGNLVKLPGGVHRVTGKHNDYIGESYVPSPVPIEELTSLSLKYPEVGMRKRHGEAPTVIEYPCVHDIQEGVKEGGRNTHLFHLATMLRRWSISDENIEAIIRKANDASEDGPLPDEELEQLLDSSQYSGPICSQLDDSVHCGDQCILARHQGLYTRAGSLKWAQTGEKVVMEVADRTDEGRMVELTHPDATSARAALAEAAKRKDHDA